MSTQNSAATIPVAWLRPLPEGYQIPLWRWILLPATALMLKRNGGVWISGQLTMTASELSFAQSQLLKSAQAAAWSVPLDAITDVDVKKGLASEIIEIRYEGATRKLMSARSADFVAGLRKRISQIAA